MAERDRFGDNGAGHGEGGVGDIFHGPDEAFQAGLRLELWYEKDADGFIAADQERLRPRGLQPDSDRDRCDLSPDDPLWDEVVVWGRPQRRCGGEGGVSDLRTPEER